MDLHKAMGHLAGLNEPYVRFHSTIEEKFLKEREGTRATYRMLLPEFTPDVISTVFDKPAVAPSSIAKDTRSDLSNTLWADMHKLARSAGRPILQEVWQAAADQPDNAQLAAVTSVAEDIYAALVAAYKPGKAVETRFKSDVRKSFALNGGDLDENALSLARETADQEWKDLRSKLLGRDDKVYEARLDMRDALLSDLSAMRTTSQEGQQKLAEKRGTLIADYSELFPEVSDDTLLDAVILGEKIAIYSFVASFGFKTLSDEALQAGIRRNFKLGPDGAAELAEIGRTLAEPPFNAAIGDGLDDAKMKAQLSGHSRQVKLYSVFEELIMGESVLSGANYHLRELGLDDEPVIHTGKEMAALMGAVAYNQRNPDWMRIAEKAFSAKSACELGDIIHSEEGAAMLNGIAGIDAWDPALEKAQLLLEEARAHVGELTITLPESAVQKYAKPESIKGRHSGAEALR